jgi:hypothetical protein
MKTAMMYPESQKSHKGKRKRASKVLETETFSAGRLSPGAYRSPPPAKL